MIHTVEGFGVVNKWVIDVFLEPSCFFDDPADIGNLISGSSAFSKTSLNIWNFSVHVLLKPGLENFERYFTSVWDKCNCVVVWAFFGIAFLRDWNEMKTDLFQSYGHNRSDRQRAWWTIDGDSWHCIGDRDQDHPQGKEMWKGKMVVWGGLTNSCEKKRSKKQRRKGTIFPFECSASKNSQER